MVSQESEGSLHKANEQRRLMDDAINYLEDAQRALYDAQAIALKEPRVPFGDKSAIALRANRRVWSARNTLIKNLYKNFKERRGKLTKEEAINKPQQLSYA